MIDTTTVFAWEQDVFFTIGKIVITWSSLEHRLSYTINLCTGLSMEDASAILYANNSGVIRFTLALSILENHNEDQRLDFIIDTIRRIKDLYSQRNKIIHGSLLDTQDGPKFLDLKKAGKTEDFPNVIDLIAKHLRDLENLCHRLVEYEVKFTELTFEERKYIAE